MTVWKHYRHPNNLNLPSWLPPPPPVSWNMSSPVTAATTSWWTPPPWPAAITFAATVWLCGGNLLTRMSALSAGRSGKASLKSTYCWGVHFTAQCDHTNNIFLTCRSLKLCDLLSVSWNNVQKHILLCCNELSSWCSTQGMQPTSSSAALFSRGEQKSRLTPKSPGACWPSRGSGQKPGSRSNASHVFVCRKMETMTESLCFRYGDNLGRSKTKQSKGAGIFFSGVLTALSCVAVSF